MPNIAYEKAYLDPDFYWKQKQDTKVTKKPTVLLFPFMRMAWMSTLKVAFICFENGVMNILAQSHITAIIPWKKELSSWHFNWINHSKMAFWCTSGILLSNVNLRGTNSFHPWKKHDILVRKIHYYFFHAMSRNNMCLFTFAVVVTGIFVVSFWALLKHHLFRTKENTQICKWGKNKIVTFFETRKQFGR